MKNEQKPLKERCKECVYIFALCLAVSIGLIVAGFFVPPTGKIDGSILTAVGELFAFTALAVGAHAINLGYDLKLSKGDTSVELHND